MMDQWKKAFTKKGDDAMDTTPGWVKARATNTRPPLNTKSYERKDAASDAESKDI